MVISFTFSCTEFRYGNLMERDHMEDVGVRW